MWEVTCGRAMLYRHTKFGTLKFKKGETKILSDEIAKKLKDDKVPYLTFKKKKKGGEK